MRRLLPHKDIGTMNSRSVWLAIAEIIISRERSQYFLLKGTKLGCRAHVMQMHVSVCEEMIDSYSQSKQEKAPQIFKYNEIKYRK